jgi:hypothetical protein
MDLLTQSPIDIPENVFAQLKPEQLLVFSNLPIKVGNRIFVLRSVDNSDSNSSLIFYYLNPKIF